MFGDCGGACCAWPIVDPPDIRSIDATAATRVVLDIFVPLSIVIIGYLDAMLYSYTTLATDCGC
jgi:hypothetical protein